MVSESRRLRQIQIGPRTNKSFAYLLAPMLRICSLAGESLATFSAHEVEGKRVKALKAALAQQIGVTRFRQRWLNEDHTELHDDAVAPCCDVQLVVMSFVQATKAELRQLLFACRENDPNELVELLRRPLNPDGVDERQRFLPAFHLAAQHGHSQIVRLLLEAGTDADMRERPVDYNDYDFSDDADDDGDDDYEYYGQGRTALHIAAEYGQLEVVKLLFQAGADKDAFDSAGSTALHMAAEFGNLDVVKLLLEAGCEKDVAEQIEGLTALHLAVQNGHSEVVKLLLDASADKDMAHTNGATALQEAACNGHSEIVKLLLEAGTDKDAVNRFGMTALLSAAQKGHSDVVKVLLEAGADKDMVQSNGATALHLAARNGQAEIVKLLLEAGADKGVKDFQDRLPLDLAFSRGYEEVFRLLQPTP